jgi:hypothetical protein
MDPIGPRRVLPFGRRSISAPGTRGNGCYRREGSAVARKRRNMCCPIRPVLNVTNGQQDCDRYWDSPDSRERSTDTPRSPTALVCLALCRLAFAMQVAFNCINAPAQRVPRSGVLGAWQAAGISICLRTWRCGTFGRPVMRMAGVGNPGPGFSPRRYFRVIYEWTRVRRSDQLSQGAAPAPKQILLVMQWCSALRLSLPSRYRRPTDRRPRS